ncbi:MAG: TrkA family potassium uptake protein [Bacillales bacterium]|jgi:trk system potassium uptake protein TrkA|nr:TrkA family potassium uptake protein [Bacillales bacterium]
MKKKFLVIGLGSFGQTLVKTLASLKTDVVAIDNNPEALTTVADFVDKAFKADSRNISNLKELGVENFDRVIICVGSTLETTILTFVNLKELGVNKISVKVSDNQQLLIMQRLGADEVILPEEASAISLANKIMSDDFINYYPTADGFGIVQIKLIESFISQSLIEMNVREKFDVNVVGVNRNGSFFIPKGTDILEQGDILVVIGKTGQLNKFNKFLHE